MTPKATSLTSDRDRNSNDIPGKVIEKGESEFLENRQFGALGEQDLWRCLLKHF